MAITKKKATTIPKTILRSKKTTEPPVLKSPRKLTKAERETVEAVSPEHQQAAVDSITYVPLEFSEVKYTPNDPANTAPGVYVNEHRNTCIRAAVGRSKVTYIPMDPEGIMVKKAGIDSFNAEWRLTLADEDIANAARRYLLSYQALRHISEEARTLLEGISTQGANFKSTTKENHMNTTVTTKPAADTKPKGFDKKAAAASYTAAVGPKGKTPAKGAAKPAKAPSKTTSKAAKPTAKPAKASTSKAAKAEKYAGKTIKPLFKVEEVAAREGTWTRFMVLAAIKAKTTDAAQKTVDASKEYAGRTVDFKWLVDKGYISIK